MLKCVHGLAKFAIHQALEISSIFLVTGNRFANCLKTEIKPKLFTRSWHDRGLEFSK